MDQSAVKLESLERSGNADIQVIETSQIIDGNQNNGLVANQLATSGIQLVQANQATSGSLPWVLPPQYQMMLLSPGMSQNLFNNGNLLTLQDGHVLVTPVSDSGQLSDGTAHAMQAQTRIAQKTESEIVSPQTIIESQPLPPQPATQKTEKPKLPKKPLNTYMMFSKAIWPQVKAANSHLSSVTEIGAIVGAIWRELDASQKQQYNEYFIKDKERYENELRAYRQMTGMSETDSIKPPKQKRCKESRSVSTTQQSAWQTTSAQNNNQHANNSTSVISQDQLRQAETLTADQLLVQQVLAQAGLSAATVSSTGQLLLTNSDGSISLDNNIINLLALHSQSFQGAQTANNLSADKQVENLVSNVISADQASWLWQAKVDGQIESVLHQQSTTENPKDGATIYYDEQQKQFFLKGELGTNSVVSGASFVDQSTASSSGCTREQLEAELQQLRSALSEKTSQVQALTSKLEEARRVIEHYQQQVQQMAVVAVAAACSESNIAVTTVESTSPASSTK